MTIDKLIITKIVYNVREEEEPSDSDKKRNKKPASRKDLIQIK